MPPAVPPAPSDSPPLSTPAMREVELKLHAAPADLGRVAALPALTALADGAAVVRRLRTAYYDTPDLRLAANGVALRVRQEDDRFVQTLKTVNSATPGDSAVVAIRREWDWPLPDDRLDRGVLTGPGVAGLVPAAALDALDCLFVTDFQRTTLMIRPDALTAVEMAVDDGHVYAGGRSLPISEIEMELKAGKVASLFDLALTLQAAVPMRIGTESKAEMGLRLVTGRAAGPVDAEPLGLSPLTTVAEAYRHILRHALRHFLANESCALAGGDVEGLHRMRVALRRLRTAHRFFAPLIAAPEADRLVGESRILAKRLGPARGWDVLLSGVIEPLLAELKTNAAERPTLERLADLARSAAAGPAREAMAAILAPGCTTTILALAAWLEHGRWISDAPPDRRAALAAPAAGVAGGWLSTRLAKTGKAGKLPDDAKGREKLRRRLRTLRYTAEFFRGLYPADDSLPFFAALEPLQEALDAEQDAVTGARMLAALHGADPVTVTAVAAWVERRSDRRRKALPELWKRFRAVPPFWS